MSNLTNANSNQNYFQFHDSHYKYKKGVLLELPISRSTFKNFLQNLEGKFIKSSSKTKALIHYPVGCPRIQCTPDLFISSYPHFMGHVAAQLAEALRYKPEGRGFDSQWCHWIFSLT